MMSKTDCEFRPGREMLQRSVSIGAGTDVEVTSHRTHAIPVQAAHVLLYKANDLTGNGPAASAEIGSSGNVLFATLSKSLSPPQ